MTRSDLIQTLDDYFEAEPMVYVAGNLLVFYEEGNRRKHVSPDVFVVRGVEKKKNERGNYLVWEESQATGFGRRAHLEDHQKRGQEEEIGNLPGYSYGVSEYFLFDPTEDYLKPRSKGSG